jgi:endonuclease/exonuclease/phosphatase family metal-dependent hydrolase
MIKKVLRFVLQIFIVLLTMIISFLVYISINDYDPPAQNSLEVIGPGKTIMADTSVFSFVSWNIGYAGLGSEMDFFYDGGKKTRPEKPQYLKYWNSIQKRLKSFDTLDFIFLQEVDVRAKRSYFYNQKDSISKLLPNYFEAFALNYLVSTVPVPIFKPLGKVNAGMLIFSRFRPTDAQRVAFPNLASWPKKLFLLDRCLMTLTIPVNDTQNLIVANIHNSYYVKDAEARQTEMDIIKDFALSEYEKGNFVVVGGDWNQNPPGLENKEFANGDLFEATHIQIGTDFMPANWEWVYDQEIPSNRDVGTAYEKSITPTTVIDYFLISPNIEKISVKTFDLGFENADHQPVFFKVKLKHSTN